LHQSGLGYNNFYGANLLFIRHHFSLWLFLYQNFLFRTIQNNLPFSTQEALEIVFLHFNNSN